MNHFWHFSLTFDQPMENLHLPQTMWPSAADRDVVDDDDGDDGDDDDDDADVVDCEFESYGGECCFLSDWNYLPKKIVFSHQ